MTHRRIRLAQLLALAFALAGCAKSFVALREDDTGPDPSMLDAGSLTPDDAPSVDAAPPLDALPGCATSPAVVVAGATRGVVVGRDGTVYFSLGRYVGRITPAGAVEPDWLLVQGQPPDLERIAYVRVLALDPSNTHLYASTRLESPDTEHDSDVPLYVHDLRDPASIVTIAAMVGRYGMTFDEDGLFSTMYVGGTRPVPDTRVVFGDPPFSATVDVTPFTDPIHEGYGLALAGDGRLLVASREDGTIIALTLDASHMSTAREVVGTVPGATGIAIDALDRIYVSTVSEVVRLDASGLPEVTVLSGFPDTSSLEWGTDQFGCRSLYVATGAGLVRVPTDVGQRAVPWH